MEKIVKQARKPTGVFGRLMARGMNYGHKVAGWGLNHLSIHQDYIVLDVGCGGGKTINTMAKIATEGKVYGIDYSEDSVAVANKINKKFTKSGKVEILHASVESIPFPNNFFDLVTAVESYYFWPDLIEDLKEIYRVLKPRGCVALINECYIHEKFEKRNANWAKLGNFEYHSPEEFREFLRNAGYSSIKIHTLEDKNWITAIGTKR
ncbi:MAG: class I SAM-dependent methyltransferase [Halobacteriota archaeon]|nr:class I SAM-dependent methyltransferase [Halobacteriota archaeon]